mgnify:CR=1 FL=1
MVVNLCSVNGRLIAGKLQVMEVFSSGKRFASRAMFSFMCQNFNVLAALDFADTYQEIFKKDKIKYANLELNIFRSSDNKWSATNLFKLATGLSPKKNFKCTLG